MPLSQAQAYLDHLGSCSPCYREFRELQAKYRQRRTRIVFALVASVLIVAGLATWAMLRQHNEQIVRIVIDLRDRTIARGTETLPTEVPLEIPRKATHLLIYLPLGSSEGFYDVRIASTGGEPLFTKTGDAKIDRGLIELNVEVEKPLPSPGNYVLQLRKPPAEWVSFRLRIR